VVPEPLAVPPRSASSVVLAAGLTAVVGRAREPMAALATRRSDVKETIF
jgi:hypothetical protein